MGFVSDFANYLRTGVFFRAEGLQRYSQWELATASWAITDEAAYVREGYRQNPILYRCVELLAATVSTPDLVGYSQKAAGEELLALTDPLMGLLQRPSSDYKTQTRLVRLIVRRMMLSGEFWAFKVPGERTGKVVDLQPLHGYKMRVRRGRYGVEKYEYHFDPAQPPVILDPEQVLYLKLDDPMDEDRGLGPLAAAARDTDVDNAVTGYRKAFFDNAAITSGILTTDQPATPRQLEEWGADWRDKYGGKKNAGRTPVLGGGLSYQRVGALPGEIAFNDIVALSQANVCSALGVPPILVNAKVGLDRATYSNYGQARSSLWEDTVSPLLVLIADEFTHALVGPAEGKVCRFDTSKVPALQEDREKKAERYGRGLDRGTITINEYREAIGARPVDDGDVYLRRPGVIVIPAGELDVQQEESEPVEEVLDEGEVRRELSPAPNGSPNGHVYRDQPPAEIMRDIAERAGFPTQTIERRELSRDEKRMRRAIEDVFEEQLAAVVEGLPLVLGEGDTVALREARASSPFGFLVDTALEIMLSAATEVARTAEAVRSHISRILGRSGKDAAGELGAEWDGEAFDVDAYAEQAAMDVANSMTGTTREIVRRELEAGLAAGEGRDALADRLEGAIKDRSRAERIAGTEGHRSAEAGKLFGYRQAGISRVRWRTTSSEPCEFCEALAARGAISIDEGFARLGDELEGTGGGTMRNAYAELEHPPLHPNCNCELEPVED